MLDVNILQKVIAESTSYAGRFIHTQSDTHLHLHSPIYTYAHRVWPKDIVPKNRVRDVSQHLLSSPRRHLNTSTQLKSYKHEHHQMFPHKR